MCHWEPVAAGSADATGILLTVIKSLANGLGGNNLKGDLAWESGADPVPKAPHTPSPSPSTTLYRLTEQRAGELCAGESNHRAVSLHPLFPVVVTPWGCCYCASAMDAEIESGTHVAFRCQEREV